MLACLGRAPVGFRIGSVDWSTALINTLRGHITVFGVIAGSVGWMHAIPEVHGLVGENPVHHALVAMERCPHFCPAYVPRPVTS
jgi:hypothetical protein